MKNHLALSLAAAALGATAFAQEITPVWLEHVNGLVNVAPENKLPTLVKAGGTGDNTYSFDGTDVIDSYVSFVKYDDDHYLLGIRENGINENDTSLSQEMKDRAAAYPDRSVIWIDAKTGKPLGVALQAAVVPVSLAAQSTAYAWWKFGVQDGANGQRAIYTGFRYKVLRYAPGPVISDPNFPSGRPTWSLTPTEAWVEPVEGEPSGDGSSGGDGSASWRLKAFRVAGAGNATTLWIGGGTWRASMQPQELGTTDGGLTFQPLARLNDRSDNTGDKGTYSQGGQPSSIVHYPVDSTRPGLAVAYHPHYPGAGWDARPTRHTKNPNGDGSLPRNGGTGRPDFFEIDAAGSDTFPAFNWEAAGKDGVPINNKVDGVDHYDGNWVMTCDTKDGLDYVVTYAIPSWNQVFGNAGDPNATFKPGWIGVHTLDGTIASGNSGLKLPVYETDEPIVDPNGNGGTGHDYGYDGDINVYPVAGAPANSGKSLVLWAGGVYGFGVAQVQNVAASIVTAPASMEVVENSQVTLTATITGSPNKYHWYKGNVALEASTNYVTDLTHGINKAALTILNSTIADSGSYVLKITNPLGNLQTTPATLTVKSDTVPPTVLSVVGAKSQDVDYVEVTFSERMEATTAGTAANYKLSGGATVQEASVTGESTVALVTSALTPGTQYTLTVSNVKDIGSGGGNPIAANTQVKFTTGTLTPGYVLFEYFANDGSGTLVDNLIVDDPNYPKFPAKRVFLTSFTTSPDHSNFAETFGGRLSGWLTPTVSGQYRFFIRSDDNSRLFLSSTSDASQAVQIADEPGCCNAFLEPLNGEGNPNTQTSEPQDLVAGQTYFIYAVYKEGGGGDFCEVAWRKEGDATPAANLLPIPGTFIKSYKSAAPVAPKFNTPTVSGSQFTVTWSGTGKLQQSTNLTSWSDVAGSPSGSYTTSITAGSKLFYRLVQ